MKIAIAQIISFLFNPILLLVFVPLLLVYKSTGNIVSAFIWTVYTMIFLLALVFFIIYGVHKKIFTDMDVSKRTQRPLLFIVCLVMGLLYLWGLYFLNGPKILMVIVIGLMISVLLASLINLKIKASIHVATVSALLFALAIVYQGYYYIALLLIPTVAWSRLTIKRHTLPETIVGGCFGILLSLGVYLFVTHIYMH
ncbi:MAG TPA: phosphatase PAP2 family protein [Candidatus Saccharimonadales bacterium]|nr:phosphatase PAP2 family protein [Candidatus Saccharimonadales bacterium]